MSIWPPTCLTFVYASMLSLNSVALILMLLLAAMASTWAWYQWSPQVIQLNVPVGAALGAAVAGAALGAAEPAAEVGAAVGAAVAAVEQAATMPPMPTAALAAAVTLRNCRLLYSRM